MVRIAGYEYRAQNFRNPGIEKPSISGIFMALLSEDTFLSNPAKGIF
jgi:hypothetical protein